MRVVQHQECARNQTVAVAGQICSLVELEAVRDSIAVALLDDIEVARLIGVVSIHQILEGRL